MKLNLMLTAYGHWQASPMLFIYLYCTPCMEEYVGTLCKFHIPLPVIRNMQYLKSLQTTV